MDGLLSEVVSLKALMSFWTFISMSKNSQAEPSAMSGQERLGYGEPLGAENHSMNQNSNTKIGTMLTTPNISTKIINI
jgi:hypothetical protein